jgi:Zn-dependent alcohol dehydrogenase
MYRSKDPLIALPILLEPVRAGRLELALLVGPIYPFERVNEAFAESMAGSAGRVPVAP